MAQIIETVTPDEAYKILRSYGIHTSAVTLRRGIEQGVFPFGDCVQCESSPVFFVYKRKLDEWIAERVTETNEEAV